MKKLTKKNKIAILEMAIKSLSEKPLSYGMCFQIENAERILVGKTDREWDDLTPFGIIEPEQPEDDIHWYPLDENGRALRLAIMKDAIINMK